MIRAGSRWIPRYPDRGKHSALEIVAVVELANGTNYIAQQVDYIGKNPRTRRLTYKNLLAKYDQAPAD